LLAFIHYIAKGEFLLSNVKETALIIFWEYPALSGFSEGELDAA